MCAQNMRERGTCSTSSPEGDVPGGLGRIHSFISRSWVSHCRSGAADKAKAGDWSAVRTSALHCTTQMATKSEVRSGREEGGDGIGTRKVSPYQETICRSIVSRSIRIAFIRGYRESDSHDAFYKSTMGIVPLIVYMPIMSAIMSVNFFLIYACFLSFISLYIIITIIYVSSQNYIRTTFLKINIIIHMRRKESPEI